MSYRDDMEAARLRVEILERELQELLPDGDRAPLAVEVLELRRRLASVEDSLREERESRRRAEERLQSAEGEAQRLSALEESLERVQAELQRRRRVGEALWRKAAQADLRSREADHLREALKEARAAAEREARRADVAEVSLIRTTMRLAIEQARPRVDDPWPPDALDTARDALRQAYDRDALDALDADELGQRIARLALLLGDLLWSAPPADPEVARELFELLRDAGHPLERRSDIRVGPPARDDMGLRMAIGPLALRLSFRRRDGLEVRVTIDDDHPLRVETLGEARAPQGGPATVGSCARRSHS